MTVPIFDLDGTLLDSDQALLDAFVRLGKDARSIGFGHPIHEACADLGLTVDQYVAAYRSEDALAFSGVGELLAHLGRWAVCSNKARALGERDLERNGWTPEAAWFADDFAGQPKSLAPVLDQLGVPAADVVFIGDTVHDQRCAEAAGVRFLWAGWNRRVAEHPPTGNLALLPVDLLDLLD